MAGKKAFMTSLAIMVASLAFVLVFTSQVKVQAQPGTVEPEGVGYNVNASMADNLKSLTGKKISVTLQSGKILAGYLKSVGDQLIHIEKLEGKEYFDALIRLESISAIDARFRGERR